MKFWLSHLPLEVWVDCYRYPGKSRKELGEMADKLGYKFAEFLQFYLHDWGKRTLGYLDFQKEGIYKCFYSAPNTEKMDFVQTPMPENIKFFERITITHFDSSAIDFLHRINTLFIANDVNLRLGFFNDNMANLRTVLDHLLPLLHGIHSLSFDQRAIPLVQHYFTPKLAQIKMLKITFNIGPDQTEQLIQTTINFCLNWLTSGDQTEPKLLKMKVFMFAQSEFLQRFSQAVQQQFLSAKSASTFAIELIDCFVGMKDPVTAANFQLENGLGEQLHVRFVNEFLLFHRHPPNAGAALQEWIAKTEGKRYKSSVKVNRQVTIGQLDANAGANEVNDNAGKEAEEKPTTSKKP